ncbi:MAG TPA: hypothetical protein VMJ11_20505 [Paraburkholderia sp.]|uniref:hypothetical protein n=1 Tax=Paraburkholderia sp. TaxID=1926495 RepID=UPI002C3E1BD0|nr:hypothetical protein [Paraburkholderia sp.]HTR08985.1 hypothetical protein [Paraburkholderia sp.]
MPRDIQWKRGLLRLWALATLLWIIATLWSVVVPHYTADAPLTPSAIEIQRNIQNRLDCLGNENARNADEPSPSKCAAKPREQDPRLDVSVQTASDGSLTIILGNGERLEGVPPNVSAKEVADKLHRQFADEDSKALYEPAARDAVLVLAPPFIVLLLGFAIEWVLRGFSGHRRGDAVDK